MVSTSKDALTLPDAVEALCDKVFPHSHLITPNIDEASRLAGFRIRSIEDMDRAAVLLRDRYRCAFLVKGGDLSAAVCAEGSSSASDSTVIVSESSLVGYCNVSRRRISFAGCCTVRCGVCP